MTITRPRHRKQITSQPRPGEERKEFIPRLSSVTPSEHRAESEEIRAIVTETSMSNRRILQAMAYLNFLIYTIAKNDQFNGIWREGDVYNVDKKTLDSIIAIADDGELTGAFPTTGVCDYMVRHWPNVSFCRSSILNLREYLRSELSLFDFEPGIARTRATPQITQINYKRMLLTYEALENELAYRFPDNEHYKMLPKHKGGNVVKIFDCVFMGYFKYRRNWRLDSGAVIHEEAIAFRNTLVNWAYTPWTKLKSWGEILKTKVNKAWNEQTQRFEEYRRSPWTSPVDVPY